MVEGGLEPGSFWCHVLCVRVLAARCEAAGQCVKAKIRGNRRSKLRHSGPQAGKLEARGG